MEDVKRREVMRLAIEHRTAIWGYLMGLTKNPHKAEDLFQNTYLVVCEKWQQYQHGTNFVAWALKIARYEFLASVDPARRSFVTVEAEVLENALGSAAEPSEAMAEKREALRKCIETLQTKSRKAFVLRYGDSLSCPRVAEKMGLTLNALYTLLSRVRQALQECVERRIRLEEAKSMD
jgi:RNA polymerase sigma-70 factor, ECF subfamily